MISASWTGCFNNTGILSKNFVYEGDSYTQVTLQEVWTLDIANMTTNIGNYSHINVAQSSDTILNMLIEYASQVHPYAKTNTTDQPYFFLWAGKNDINSLRNATAIYNDLKTEWAEARADGFKVIVFTIGRDCGYGYQQGWWAYNTTNELNSLILSDDSLYDIVIRPDLFFPDCTNSILYLDTVHYTYYGEFILAQNITNYFDSVCPVVSVQSDFLNPSYQSNSFYQIMDSIGSGLAVLFSWLQFLIPFILLLVIVIFVIILLLIIINFIKRGLINLRIYKR